MPKENLSANIRTQFLVLLNQPKKLLLVGLTSNTFYVFLFFLTEQRGFEDSLWWGWVTGFTVGYGDISPITTLGRTIAIANMGTNFLLLQFLGAHIITSVLIDRNAFDHTEQELLKQRAEEQSKILCDNAAALRRIELQLGTLPQNAPPLPLFKTNSELQAKITVS